MAADYALLSTEAQYFSLQGVEQALEMIELAKENLHPDLEWLGVVLNIADLRTIHSREALVQLRERFGEQGLRRGHPAVDPLRGVGRARRLDHRLPRRSSATTTSAWPTRCSTGSASPGAHRLRELRSELVPA